MSSAGQRPLAVLRIDHADERVQLGDVELKLTRRAFEVLAFLHARPNRLVTKDELFARVWRGSAVSESALTTVVREVRRALGERSRGARYLQTVHRRGYRYVGPVVSSEIAAPEPAVQTPALFGRDSETRTLRGWLADCASGARRIAFLSGEPGIGKTALVEAFAASLHDVARMRFATGQCVELYGAAEPYLPWLDALGALARRVDGAQVVEVLRRVAPLWLAQLPAFVAPIERRTLLQEAADAPPQRMFRELADALALLGAERPLVIVLEDLHWADRPSIELLAWIARRREPAKLLVLGTFRPRETGRRDHPLRGVAEDLLAQRRAAILELGDLSATAVRELLAVRFPGLPARFAELVRRRTDGHPLFLLNLLEHLQRRDLIACEAGRWVIRGDVGELETAVPDSLRAMIESQLERLEPVQRRILEVACVAGIEFCDASIAPALEAEVEEIGRRCIDLTRQSVFLADAGELEWPDGTATRRFVFRHALYPEVLCDALPPSRRVQVHRQIAERLEAGHAGAADTIAAELATHFERGRDRVRAVTYLAASARNASRRQAFDEAIASLRRAARLLESLPDDEDRRRQELAIRMALAPMLMITRGYAAAEAEQEYARAEQLCRLGAEDREIFSALLGRSGPALLMGRTELARDLAAESLRLAKRRGALRYLAHAESSVGITTFWRGEITVAAEHLEAGRLAYSAIDRMPANAWLAHDPGAAGRAYAAWAFWLLGRADRARVESAEAVALARSLHHPFSLAFALAFGAFVHQARRDVPATLAHAEATIETCAAYGFAMYHAVGSVFSGWGRAQQGDVEGGIAVMEAALGAYHATGANLVQPYFRALIAEAYAGLDRLEPARTLLEDASSAAQRTGELVYLPEIERLRAEVDRREAELEGSVTRNGPMVERRLRNALALAHSQRSTGLALRAATSLARFLQAQGRTADAIAGLTEVRVGVSEGFDTPDWVDSSVLLQRLERERESGPGTSLRAS